MNWQRKQQAILAIGIVMVSFALVYFWFIKPSDEFVDRGVTTIVMVVGTYGIRETLTPVCALLSVRTLRILTRVADVGFWVVYASLLLVGFWTQSIIFWISLFFTLFVHGELRKLTKIQQVVQQNS